MRSRRQGVGACVALLVATVAAAERPIGVPPFAFDVPAGSDRTPCQYLALPNRPATDDDDPPGGRTDIITELVPVD